MCSSHVIVPNLWLMRSSSLGIFLRGQHPWLCHGSKLELQILLLDVQEICQALRIKASGLDVSTVLWIKPIIFCWLCWLPHNMFAPWQVRRDHNTLAFSGIVDGFTCNTWTQSATLPVRICPVYALFALPRIYWDRSVRFMFHMWLFRNRIPRSLYRLTLTC